MEELKKITWEKNEKISDLMIIDKIDLKKENYKNILEYSYTINTEKNKDIDLTPIKNNTLNNINNPEDKEDLEFIENIKKFNIYLRYKYFDIDWKYFWWFEISPYEINLYETKKYESDLENIKIPEIKKPEINLNYWKTEKVITSNTNLRKFPWKNSERIRVLQKWEKIFFYDSQYLIEKDWFDWFYVTTENWENWYMVLDWNIN